ncbi:hypothetical protein SLS60_002945 [Paraconiothyrium brasiliense]|uniref:Uncharacterized protein n=1 Tax=Paraconiothyrium brasiliense TaxID=300254 RepID=A0ABR3RU94_9PLEO
MFSECSPPAIGYHGYSMTPPSAGPGTYCNTTDIYCATPVKVQVRAKTWLLPHRDLGSAFANGWNKLADEMKLHILSQNLRFDDCIAESSHEEYKMLRHHLRMTPEIAVFSKEVFYSRNSMDLNGLDISDPLDAEVAIPPQIAMPFVSRAQITVRLSRNNDWPVLFACFRILRKFPKFQYLRVVFEWTQNVYVRDLIEDSDKEKWISVYESRVNPKNVEFGCKGEVIFRGIPVLENFDGELVTPNDTVIDNLYEFFKGKVLFDH